MCKIEFLGLKRAVVCCLGRCNLADVYCVGHKYVPFIAWAVSMRLCIADCKQVVVYIYCVCCKHVAVHKLHGMDCF